jgi:YVTN family beta-propeller protein
MTFDPENGDIYATALLPDGNGSLLAISGTNPSDFATDFLPGLPWGGLTFDPANGDVYVATMDSTVLAFSPSAGNVVSTVEVGKLPGTPLFAPANGDLYVGNAGSNNLSVVSSASNEVVATIPLGGSPGPDLAWDAATEGVLVPVSGSAVGNLTIISTTTNRIVATQSIGGAPEAPVLDPINGEVYQACAFTTDLTVLLADTDTQVLTLALGGSITSPALDPQSGGLYVPNDAVAGVSIVSGYTNTVVENLSFGGPGSFELQAPPLWDPENGEVFVPATVPGTSASPGYLFVIGNSSTSSPPPTYLFPAAVVGTVVGVGAVAVAALVVHRKAPPAPPA